jgi:hypothetical protein
MVARAYSKAVGRRFFRHKIKPGSAQEKSVLEFWHIVVHSGKDLDTCMGKVVGMYSEEWTQQIFHSKFPPFPVVVGPSSRKTLSRDTMRVAPQTREQSWEQAREIAKMLVDNLGIASACEVVNGGWPEDKLLHEYVGMQVLEFGRKSQ